MMLISCSNFKFSSCQKITFKKEWCLLRHYWWRILLSLLLTIYLCGIVARNLAFMRHFPISHYVRGESQNLVERTRLEDIGFDLLPDWSNNVFVKVLNEVTAVCSQISVILFIMVIPFVKRASQRDIYAINILTRYVFCYATVHFLRSIVYLSTSLPGPASHCVNPQMLEKNQPKTIYDIFASADFSVNCGDLLYSGHMAGYITGCCVLIYYLNKLLVKDTTNKPSRCCYTTPWPVIGLTMICIIGMLIQAMCMIGTRQHYTVDTVMGIIAGYWNFVWHLCVLRPKDMLVSCEEDIENDCSNSLIEDVETPTNGKRERF